MIVFGKAQKRHPAQPIAKQNVPDARKGSPKGFPCPYFTTKGGEFTYQSSFFIKKSNLRKERGSKMAFFTTAVTGLKTVVTAIGAGVAVWGVINLLEGYGNDNPGANAHVW